MIKRVFDLILSIFLLLILSPLFIILCLIVRWLDGSPVIFKQPRVGQFGVDFTIFKFRTMTNNVDKNYEFDCGSSFRITKLGSFLRKYKFDELPQLYNILIGNMSFVGPRPEVKKWVELFHDDWKSVLEMKPGITDFASIYYRNEENILKNCSNPEKYYSEIIMPHKFELHKRYKETQSLMVDIKLIIKTIIICFK